MPSSTIFRRCPSSRTCARLKRRSKCSKLSIRPSWWKARSEISGLDLKIHEKAPDLSAGLTSPAEAKQFVEETGVDILAPAVGNMHGMLKSMVQGQTRKRLDIRRIAEIKNVVHVPLTLHGGSGTDDDDLRNAIAAGIDIIHINTELRVAWRRGLEEGLSKQPNEVVPYKILPFAVDSVEKVARSRLELFNAGR